MSQSDNNRLNWFLDRIGKRVWSTFSEKYWMIEDRDHAKWLYSNEYLHETPYFDTKEEAEHVKTNQK